MSDINKQQEEIIAEAYEQWLSNPITKLMFKNLAVMQHTHLTKGMNNAYNTDIDDNTFRLNAYAAKTVETVIHMLSNVERFKIFTEQLNKQ